MVAGRGPSQTCDRRSGSGQGVRVTNTDAEPARHRIEEIYRTESRRVFATLVRLLGDFDLAEEALHEAFVAAITKWPVEGIPANPRAWLVSAGRFKGIDRIRRRVRFDRSLQALARLAEERPAREADELDEIGDDRLRLVFTCCHPALSAEAQIALTLREVCGLTTEETARAFLIPATTVAQRIVRAKRKIREARIPYEIPERSDLPHRLDAVLHVIYLVYNEGYSATAGPDVTRGDLSGEAIRLGRLLVGLLQETEAIGLLALMLLHESRRSARTSSTGDLVLLVDQDRTLWDRSMIAEGLALVRRAFASREVGPYALQAAIAAVHADAADPAATDWREIVALYDLLLRAVPSPIVGLNRAVAVAMLEGPEAGISLIDAILDRGDLVEYHLSHAARAELCRRLGRAADARESYLRARDLAGQEPERRYLERRIGELASGE